MKKYRLLSVLSLVLVAGCASPSIYYWGDYEDLLYTSYVKPSEATPERQIKSLEADLQKAKGKGLAVPPGLHAHLGFLYYQTGNFGKAGEHFEIEKLRFPESSTLMDRFLRKIKKS